LKHPKVLILDDATSAVDTATEKNIRNGLSELKDMTKIIISQRVLSVLEADEVMILEGGKINEINTPAELLKHNPIFQDLYNRQLGGISHE
jgi:ATP-binding cassette subfamily B protein